MVKLTWLNLLIRYDICFVSDHYLSDKVLCEVSSQQAANRVLVSMYVVFYAS